MPDFTIQEGGVVYLLNQLDPNKASGPDQIPSRYLILFSEEIAPILTIIFQQSLETGQTPTEWKEAHVAPIFKKGDQSDPVNYRPVSLTSYAVKLSNTS